MKYFNMNRHSIVSKVLLLLLFVALGCSQRGCSCKRLETIKQEIILSDRLGENAKGQFPADFVNLLYIKNLLCVKDADTLLQRFKPNVTLKRLDANKKFSNVQKLGMNDWQRFLRSIFTLSPDNYDPDLENRFITNEIGNDLSEKSQFGDSLKIATINKYLLTELQEPQRCKLYFFSSNINNNFYCCKINLTDTSSNRSPGSYYTKQQIKKNGKGAGCANFETASNKNQQEIRKLDTVFQVYHSIDCINFLIAKNADSGMLNGSGCSVKDRTVKHIIIYEPPNTCTVNADTTKMLNVPAEDTMPNKGSLRSKSSEIKLVVRSGDLPESSCKFILQTTSARLKFNQENTAKPNRQPLITSPDSPDSIVWELSKWSAGLNVIMPDKKVRGIKEIPSFEVSKDPRVKRGTITFKVTPYKADCEPSRSPVSSFFVYKFSLEPKGCAKNDTVAINQLRRHIINDFRELLFMYAKTQTPTEQKFFRTSALNKISEIPNVRVDIIPKNDISTFLDDISTGASAWALPRVTPILDGGSCLIIGVTIEQK